MAVQKKTATAKNWMTTACSTHQPLGRSPAAGMNARPMPIDTETNMSKTASAAIHGSDTTTSWPACMPGRGGRAF
eukprot:3074951-Prymnesium_polylepis.1